MELETLIPYLFIVIFLSVIFLIRSQKQYEKLDTDTKLKLIEINFYVKKIYYIGLLCILSLSYIVGLFNLFDINILFVISILVLATFAQFLSNKRIEQLELPKTFIKNVKIRAIVLCIITVAALAYICIALLA